MQPKDTSMSYNKIKLFFTKFVGDTGNNTK